MSDAMRAALAGALVGAVVAAVIALVGEYVKLRRSELLTAYSEWMAAVQLALMRNRVHLFRATTFDALKKDQERRRDLATRMDPRVAAQLISQIESQLIDAAEPLISSNDRATDAETQLGVALNRVLLVEGRAAFRKRALELSQPVWRWTGDAPPDEFNANPSAYELAYLSRIQPLTKETIGAFLVEVGEAHAFRGLCSEPSYLGE